MAIPILQHPLLEEYGIQKIDFFSDEKSKALLYYEQVVLKKDEKSQMNKENK